MKVTDIPIPHEMRKLPRDPRGFPIFTIALRDETGRAHFVINDHRRVVQVSIEHRCGICGRKLPPDEQWFIGGLLSAFHPDGVFIDPHMHYACAHYSLLVCPHLANARYSGIDIAKAAQRARENLQRHLAGFADHTMIKGKPVCFAAVRANGCSFDINETSVTFRPNRPYWEVQYWRDGERLPKDVGDKLRDDVLAGRIKSVR